MQLNNKNLIYKFIALKALLSFSRFSEISQWRAAGKRKRPAIAGRARLGRFCHICCPKLRTDATYNYLFSDSRSAQQ
jgi:hypothetical protein